LGSGLGLGLNEGSKVGSKVGSRVGSRVGSKVGLGLGASSQSNTMMRVQNVQGVGTLPYALSKDALIVLTALVRSTIDPVIK
jgi:uncharacterized membrane protein